MGDFFFSDEERQGGGGDLMSACASGNWEKVKKWLRLGAVFTQTMHAAAERVVNEFGNHLAMMEGP